MKRLFLLLAFSSALVLSGCGGETPATQPAGPAAFKPKPVESPADLTAHDTDSASLEDVQQLVLTQLHRDPLVGNVGHDFAHLIGIYQRSIRAGALVELRTGHDPALLKVAAAVRDRAQQVGAEAARLATRLNGRGRNYPPNDITSPFTRGVRESLKVSMRAHAAAQLPDHDFAALLLAQRQSEATIARAALNTGLLPAPARALARQVLAPRPAETRLLQRFLRRPHPPR
jgi:hypothetical protein